MATVGAVSSNLSAVTPSSAYQSSTNDLVLANAAGGAFTVTLPIAPAANNRVIVKKTDATANLVTIALPASSTATIDGDTTVGLYTQGSGATLQYDGTNWRMTSTAMVAVPSQASSVGSMYLPWIAGRTFFATPQPQQGHTTSPLGNASIYLWPIRVPNACTITSIGVPVGSAGTWNLGVYTDKPGATSTGPAARLYTGSGTTASSATIQHAMSLTFASSTTLWIGWQPSTSIGVWYNGRTHGNLVFNDPSTANPNCCLTVTNTYANGLPADLSASTGTGLSFPTPLFTVTCG